MILLLHEPFDPTISYKELLMFSNKSNMQKALSVMGASASSNLRKAELATVIVHHLTTSAEYIWYTLSESSRKIIRELAEGDSYSSIELPHDETCFTELEKSMLTVTFFLDKQHTKGRYYMIDEVRNIFKKVLADNGDDEEIIDFPLGDKFDEEEEFEWTSYSCSIPLMEDIRKLDYKKQANLCLAFRKHIAHLNEMWRYDHFIQRFIDTCDRIKPDKLEESIAWIGYAVNDMDNAISCIDRTDPMTFFDIAGYLEKKMK